MNEYNSTNFIREPIRVTATSSSLIDVILTNRPRSFLTSGIFDLGLSDYHLVYAVSRSHYPRSCPITVERRFLRITIPSDFAKTCIRLHLTSHWRHRWHLLGLEMFLTTTLQTANREHVPFMTPELPEAIRKRNKLKRLYNESKRRLAWDRYKTLRNLTSSLRHKTVSDYFRTTAVNAKCRPKIFWQTVKPFMHSKKNISRDSIHLKEGDSLIVNKLEIAQIFSAHFSSFPKDIDSHGR